MSEPKDEQERSGNVSRRNLFHILGASVPAAAVAIGAAQSAEAQHNHGQTSETTPSGNKGSYQRKIFDDHQYQTVKVLCDLIIPADESGPSASAAGVPEFLDDWVAFRTDQDRSLNFQAEIVGGLMWLDRETNKVTGPDVADSALDK